MLDTLNYKIVFCKLRYYGFDEMLLKLIKSHLFNRSQKFLVIIILQLILVLLRVCRKGMSLDRCCLGYTSDVFKLMINVGFKHSQIYLDLNTVTVCVLWTQLIVIYITFCRAQFTMKFI